MVGVEQTEDDAVGQRLPGRLDDVGVHADGVLMVTEFGKTSMQAVKGAMRRAERGGLKIMGFVINKAERQREESYGYEYAPRKTVESA